MGSRDRPLLDEAAQFFQRHNIFELNAVTECPCRGYDWILKSDAGKAHTQVGLGAGAGFAIDMRGGRGGSHCH